MNVQLPPASGSLGIIVDAIRRAFITAVSINEAAPRILLRSPDGATWEVTVDNSGTLTTAPNSGKSRP